MHFLKRRTRIESIIVFDFEQIYFHAVGEAEHFEVLWPATPLCNSFKTALDVVRLVRDFKVAEQSCRGIPIFEVVQSLLRAFFIVEQYDSLEILDGGIHPRLTQQRFPCFGHDGIGDTNLGPHCVRTACVPLLVSYHPSHIVCPGDVYQTFQASGNDNFKGMDNGASNYM